MTDYNNILSLFLDMAIFKIDSEGNILECTLNTNEDFKVSKAKTIYDLFSKEEKFRLRRVLESGFDVRKKYMELSKITQLNEYVDVKMGEYKNGKYIYIQFFESNRDREVIYDRYIEKLTNLSERDPMTKVFNRQGFDEKVKRLIKNSDEEKRLGVIYFDIDNLKGINDTYGHKMGDKAILNVIDILISTVRERDIVARLGGDEFVIVVEEMTGSKSTSYGLAKRLLEAVAESPKGEFSTTLSMGVHVFEVGEILEYRNDPDEFFKIWGKQIDDADKATYQSKKGGKNRISVSKGFTKYYKL